MVQFEERTEGQAPPPSVGGVGRALRDERHEEGYDERPGGRQESRLRSAVGVVRSFLAALAAVLVVRVLVVRHFLCGETKVQMKVQSWNKSKNSSGLFLLDSVKVSTISCKSWFGASPSASS